MKRTATLADSSFLGRKSLVPQRFPHEKRNGFKNSLSQFESINMKPPQDLRREESQLSCRIIRVDPTQVVPIQLLVELPSGDSGLCHVFQYHHPSRRHPSGQDLVLQRGHIWINVVFNHIISKHKGVCKI